MSHHSRSVSSKFLVIGFSCLCLLTAAVATGQQKTANPPATKAPQITSVFPAGAERGSTVEIELKGKNLETVTDLYFARSVGSVDKIEAKGADRLLATLSINRDIDPGSIELRAVSNDGVSNLRLFRIDEYPEVNETSEKHSKPSQAQNIDYPTVVNGQLAAAEIDCYQIHVAKRERVIFEVEARRLGSPVEARLRLLDSTGWLLADASTTRAIRPDERLDYEFKEPGDYIVIVEDAQYVGGDGAVYRLRIGSWPYATAQFPLGGLGGETIQVILNGGNLPHSTSHTVTLPSDPDDSPCQLQFPSDHGTLMAPMLMAVVRDCKEIEEAEPNDDIKQPQPIESHCIVNGLIGRPGDKDRFVFKAKKDEKYTFEVFADRLGSLLDSVLTITGRNGQLIAENDDLRPGNAQQNPQTKTGVTPISDSRVDFKAPADGEFIVTVDDRYNAGGAEYAYCLVMTPTRPDFQLTYGPAPAAKNQQQAKNQTTPPTDIVNLEPGKSAVLPLAVVRRGYDGEIELAVEGLPDRITFEPTKIPEKQAAVQLTFKAGDQADTYIGRARVVGTAKINDQELRRIAQHEIIVAQIDPLHVARREMSDFAIALLRREPPITLHTHAEAVLARGMETQIKVSVDRKAGFKGSVEVKGDKLPKGISAEKITIPENETEAILNLVASSNAATGNVKIQLRGQGRLGTASVEASSEISLSVVMPFELALNTDETELELVAGESRSLKLSVKRLGNFEGTVEIAVAGLPAGIAVTPDRIEPDQDEVELNFVVSDEVKPSRAKKQVKIQATGDIGTQKVKVESAAITVTVKESH
jgi:hypothetical protein